MRQFQKSRIALLEELRDLVSKSLTTSEDYSLSRDIRKRNRDLKVMRKEIEKWIAELTEDEKLKKKGAS